MIRPNGNEQPRQGDLTVRQIRSFAFAKAETIARRRLHRLDELKAVSDQIMSEEGIEGYKNLRKEIVGSHGIESDQQQTKEAKEEHNRKAAEGLVKMLN